MQSSGRSDLGTSKQVTVVSAPLDTRQDDGPNLMQALLAMAQVCLKVGRFTTGSIRPIYDSGSQVNLVAEQIVQRLLIPTRQCSIRIVGINSVSQHQEDLLSAAFSIQRQSDCGNRIARSAQIIDRCLAKHARTHRFSTSCYSSGVGRSRFECTITS